ncbi:MAG: TVP38/TMEM64 family protein [Clostridia bacterium]|nr:TVP38/TMEM64 family protein [Clostridia bacterium]
MIKKHWVTIAAVLLTIGAVLFLYFDKSNNISSLIQGAGVWGVAISVLLMALIFLLPIPSEGLVVVILKIYGVFYGLLISWAGATIGSLALFYIARGLGRSLIKTIATPERMAVVNSWAERGGIPGLLVARLLPLPSFFANFIISLLPTMTAWRYIWTAAVAGLPYFITMGLLYAGMVRGAYIWLVPGLLLAVFSVAFGYWAVKKQGS